VKQDRQLRVPTWAVGSLLGKNTFLRVPFSCVSATGQGGWELEVRSSKDQLLLHIFILRLSVSMDHNSGVDHNGSTPLREIDAVVIAAACCQTIYGRALPPPLLTYVEVELQHSKSKLRERLSSKLDLCLCSVVMRGMAKALEVR
jgi:hypothetical protein